MAHKLRDSRGLTLVEMLCAVMILVLLVLLTSTGLHMAVKSYEDITIQSETELLLSTLSDALADDLRYAMNVTVKSNTDNSVISYDSVRYGGTTQLKVENGRVKANGYPMLPSGAYGKDRNGGDAYGVPSDNDLKISYTYSETNGIGIGVFTVELTVCETGGTISGSTKFTVRCLNPSEPTIGGTGP